VVHAGWRGLAAGILERALIAMGCASDNQGPIHVLVGPCAGADRYEVGPEVLQALGPSAVYRDASRGHYLLDLQETLVQRIKRIESDIRVDLVKLCTISSPEFYSYRRQGAEAGRNLTVLVVD
jgi:copper oxidase (laccase) domain-containing protein